jgi:uncharacterized phage-associated protein
MTHLVLHRILYVAQMLHLGSEGTRLIDACFQAWDFGPILPEPYRKLRIFGVRPIRDVFCSAHPINGASEAAALAEVSDHLMGVDPAKLVAITRRKGGAWARNYVPGLNGLVIPDVQIAEEYHARLATTGAAPDGNSEPMTTPLHR